MESMLTIRDLTVSVNDVAGRKTLLNNVNLEVPPLSIVGLVGGSGSGKTTTGLAILRLLPLALQIDRGSIFFQGENLLTIKEERMRALRGKDIAMIFQEPLEALNPVFSIGYQIGEVLKFHTALRENQRKERIFELLNLVGIPEPKRVAQNYPHQLSGGMRQRAMIAQAIAANPKLIIADEPTSNLDVTLQARIMELFRQLKDQLKLSILLITHDLGMVSHLADRIIVMTEGQVVEQGETKAVLSNPQAVYTEKLLAFL